MYNKAYTKKIRKVKLMVKSLKWLWKWKKKDNILSARDILKKIIDKGVNVSTSTIRWALKMRMYTYKNLILIQLLLLKPSPSSPDRGDGFLGKS